MCHKTAIMCFFCQSRVYYDHPSEQSLTATNMFAAVGRTYEGRGATPPPLSIKDIVVGHFSKN